MSEHPWPNDAELADRSAADALTRTYGPSGRVRVGRSRIGWYAFAAIVGVGAAYLLGTFAQVVHTGGSHGADSADAIIVMEIGRAHV